MSTAAKGEPMTTFGLTAGQRVTKKAVVSTSAVTLHTASKKMTLTVESISICNADAAMRQRASGVFGRSLSQAQVEGVETVLDEAERRRTFTFHLAAILSEIYHETGGQMQPVKETVYASSKDRNPTDTVVIKRLDTAFARRQLPWVTKPYWCEGWFGRGLIQITHEPNYRKLGLSKASALDLETSVRATFDGREQGLFTGRKLAD